MNNAIIKISKYHDVQNFKGVKIALVSFNQKYHHSFSFSLNLGV